MILQRLSRIPLSCCSSTAVLRRCAGVSGSNILEATSRRPKVITYVQNISCGQYKHQRREFSSIPKKSITAADTINDIKPVGVKFAALLTKHLGLSRRQSERMIKTERVTLFGQIINSPTYELFPSTDPNQDSSSAMKVDGKLVKGIDKTLKVLYSELQQQRQLNEDDVSNNINGTVRKDSINAIDKHVKSDTRIWLANKLKGELITEDDPVGRNSMIQRLSMGGVGKCYKKNQPNIHLKPVGRLDMMTEGLMIFTNDGKYARELELPINKLWRTYRVRVHGRLTMGKMRAMRKGLTVRVNDSNVKDANGQDVIRAGKMMKYKGIKVSIERKSSKGRGRGGGGTNTWLQITCSEGKNRMLRRILESLGLDVTRLIRISYGDYKLDTIPPGKAIEVNYKDIQKMKNKGPLFVAKSNGDEKKKRDFDRDNNDVQWVNYS